MESESSHTVASPSVDISPVDSSTPNAIGTSRDDDGNNRKRSREATAPKPPKPPTQTKVPSPYWDHCEKKTKDLAICNYCGKEIPTKHRSTSGLKSHLTKSCKTSPLYLSERLKNQPTLTSETFEKGSSMVTHTFSQKKCDMKLVEYVVIDEVSFRAVEGEGFTGFVHELQPRYQIPKRKKVAGMVYDLFLEEKSKMKKMISGHRVSITTDTWTSIQNINYMVVTAHFLDSDWKLHKRIINFTKITSHVGEDLGKIIEICLREWGIDKIFSVVVDNASSNDLAIGYLKKRMQIENTLLFEGKYLHLRCACHILNLIVKDGLKELSLSIKAIRNSVVYLHSSPARLNKFREFAVLAKFSSMSTVPMDVKTRWNSTYKMLEVALKYRRVFERMAEESLPFMKYFREKDDKGKEKVGPPLQDDWENARSFVYFLKKFYDATLELSATKTPTSQLIYETMVALQHEIVKKCNDGSDLILRNVAFAMKEKFEKYWGDWNIINPLIFIANVLDPRSKLQLLKVSIKLLGGTSEKVEKSIAQVKKDLVILWLEYKGVKETLTGENAIMSCEDGGDTSTRGGKGFLAELHSAVEVQNEKEQLQQISNEVDKYLADEIEKRSNPNFALLDWWKGNTTKYPILSFIAKDIFAIPSSTVASESAFSLGKRVVDPFRTSLSPKMVEALVCTNDWLRGDGFSFYKDPTDDDLELYKEIEEIEKNADAITIDSME